MYLNMISRLCPGRRFTPFLYTFRSTSSYYEHEHRKKFYISEVKLEKAFPIPGYELIYTYPRIKLLQFLASYNRTASLCTLLLTVCIPNELLGPAIIESSVLPFCYLTVIITNLITLPVKQLIGCMYYNEKENKVLLSYITYWGGRRNLIIPNKNILEIPQSSGIWAPKVFKFLDITSPKLSLKLNVKHMVIFNRGRFSYITGLEL